MPFRPQESLLSVNLETMHTIDTRSVEDLFGLWTVFSRTSNAIEDGKRLENMSWRLWNRETFCCCPETKRQARASIPSTRDIPAARRRSSNIPKIPDLASSVDTASSDDDLDATVVADGDQSPPHAVRPELVRLDLIDSRTRGSQKHMRPVDLENLVVNIQQTKAIEPIENLALPTLSEDDVPELLRKEPEAAPPAKPTIGVAPIRQEIPIRTRPVDRSASTITSTEADSPPTAVASSDSSSTAMSTHNVVRGFVSGAPSSYRSQTQLAAVPTPISKTARPLPAQAKKKAAMFTLGGSSGEDESSLESHLYKSSISSLSEGLHRHAGRKRASFRDDNLVSKIQDSPVFESDDEDDEDDDDEDVSEGVIEDDEDSSDWEDELGDEDRSDLGEAPSFPRVDSRPNLTSRRSMLTSLMHEDDRVAALQNAASRSTPAIRRTQTTPSAASSRAQSPARERNGPDGHQIARPIAVNYANLQPHLALSPRTTRRNMLSTELTESLRKNLLWERQHKSSQNVAALKRRHTSHDVKNLKQYPEAPHMPAAENTAKFNNDYFHAGLGEYHSKGW